MITDDTFMIVSGKWQTKKATMIAVIMVNSFLSFDVGSDLSLTRLRSIVCLKLLAAANLDVPNVSSGDDIGLGIRIIVFRWPLSTVDSFSLSSVRSTAEVPTEESSSSMSRILRWIEGRELSVDFLTTKYILA